MKAHRPIVLQILEAARPQTILDVPAGEGWLVQALARPGLAIDGGDLLPRSYLSAAHYDVGSIELHASFKIDARASSNGYWH
jgi:2-polyprenyl-3-methyl-5-hydroxy-6-metoxy-1,4-benzoquinol methylase